LPVSMSPEAKDLIVHLLNRNPSKRLGAGVDGANAIKKHPFFVDINWDDVRARKLVVPPPRNSYDQFKKHFLNFECKEEQRR